MIKTNHLFSIKYFALVVALVASNLFSQSVDNGKIINTNIVKRLTRTDFWTNFSAVILGRLRDESEVTTRITILKRGISLVETNLSDPFACKAMYCIGVEYYRINDYSQSRECCEKALKLPETQPGNYLTAWNQIAQCDEALGNYPAAIKAYDEVLKCNAPDIMKSDMDQIALTKKADLILQKSSSTKEERKETELILGPLTEIKNTGPFSELQGQWVRARIGNLMAMGDVKNAYNVGDHFVRSNPNDYWAGVICSDLCVLTNSYASATQLEAWVRFLTESGVTNRAGFTNLKVDLMNAYARNGNYEQASKLADEIVDFHKDATDPVPWADDNRELVKNVKIIVQNAILHNQTHDVDHPKISETKRRTILAVLIVLTTTPVIYLIFKFSFKHPISKLKNL